MGQKWLSVRAVLLVVCSLVVLIALGFSVFGDEPVEFPDHNLEQAIRDAIGKPSGTIYESDLAALWFLAANDLDISDLTGLEHCSGLMVFLVLTKNRISDISPLAGLVYLGELHLWSNQISDISPLAGLVNLGDLWLDDNQIDDISPLAGLVNLTWLSLGYNQISDISPLAGLVNLEGLTLGSNQISDISLLAGLVNLEVLDLVHNQISDISPLAGLVNLTRLYLWDNQISDPSPLAGLVDLTVLWLTGNQISDLSPLAGLVNLTGIDLWGNQISDISPLAGLVNLTAINLWGNQISDISPLAGLVNLTRLHLSDNQISDISPLLDNSQAGGLGPGDRVFIQHNYLDLSPGSPDMLAIETLIARGVGVDYEPQNVPPTGHSVGKPTTPSGPPSGQVGAALPFSTGGSTCSQGHSVQYEFDWDDETPYSSWSSAATASHSYAAADTYQVKARARCSQEVSITSSWSYGSSVGITECRPPWFLTLPFSDTSVGLQAGWEYHWATTRSHQGIDYVKKGASGKWVSFSVTAAAGGRAGQGVQPGSAGVWGRYVYIEHDETDCDGNKYFTIYAHLDAVSDRIPDSGTVRVERGEQIGWSGESGTQEGIHLHFEVSIGALPRAGERVDPYDLYSTREAYPPGDNRECGKNRLWTSDPPTLLVAE